MTDVVNVAAVFGRNVKFDPVGGVSSYIRGTSDEAAWMEISSLGNIAFDTAIAGTGVMNWTDGSASTKLMILNNGNVGIGTTNPGDKLKIQNVGDDQWILSGIGSSTSSHSYGLSIFAGTNSGDITAQFYNRAATAPYLFIRGDGNVGIGTASPVSKLNVVGEVNITGIANDGNGKVVCIKSDGNLGTCNAGTINSNGCTCG